MTIPVFLASDKQELAGIDRDTTQRLSLLAWQLLEAQKNRQPEAR